MKEQLTGSMEQEITGEAEPVVASKPQLGSFPKIAINKDLLSSRMKFNYKTLLRPRYITFVVLFFSLVSILGALVVVSSRNQLAPPVENGVEIATPVPQASTKPEDPQIKAELDKYNLKVDSLKNKSRDLSAPAVDLDITF